MPASREQTEFEPYYIKRDRPVTYVTHNDSFQSGKNSAVITNPIYNSRSPSSRPIPVPRKSIENLYTNDVTHPLETYVQPANYVEPMNYPDSEVSH
jgi:hypothetical protein